MKINKIYTTFDGEQNPYGIGMPTIFVRFQGCHIRCYAATLLTLCDTPEALDRNSKEGIEMSPEKIVFELMEIRQRTGIHKVTITGGDPLHQKKSELLELFQQLVLSDFLITVETSGTIDHYLYEKAVTPLNELSVESPISWVLDYKGKSSGIPRRMNKLLNESYAKGLSIKDYIKFVIKDDADLEECANYVVKAYEEWDIQAVTVIGPYFGGEYDDPIKLFRKLESLGLFKYNVMLNFQTHQIINRDLAHRGKSYDKTEL